MAKVIAPFKIVGTLDDLTFYLDQEKNNLVKTKGNTGVTSQEFKNNPIYDPIRQHGSEFGRCSKVSQEFRRIAVQFYNRSKEVSFAGRANGLMHEIMKEDLTNPKGQRTVSNGLQEPYSKTFFTGFEGNKIRPLKKVLNIHWEWNEEKSELTFPNFNPKTDINWPEEAESVHLAMANANWNFLENNHSTEYSNETIRNKEEKPATIILKSNIPQGNHLQLVYLFIGFSRQHRNKTIELIRSNNTVSIIVSK